ncbi:MAG: M4 family metallopeptidase [Acidobacteriota bacterium]
MACLMPPHLVEAVLAGGGDDHKATVLAVGEHMDEVREAPPRQPPPSTATPPARQVGDAGDSDTLPGTVVREEGGPESKDSRVEEAYEVAGAVYRFYREVLDRNSIDDRGMTIVSTVHYKKDFANAFWNGAEMIYGDGDGTIFKTFAVPTVTAHEITHGVIAYSGGLVYRDQPGALNESLADVFACLVEQHTLGHTAAEASWLVGQGVFADGIQATALRSLKAPGTAYDDPHLGKDPQPYHMDHYVHVTKDDGGVHINSGIPSHAFYLLAQALGGHAWEKAGQIWYGTLQALQNPHATFHDFARKTIEVAGWIYQTGSLEVQHTRRAWKLVGIDV